VSEDPLAPYIEGLERELAPLTARRAQLESEIADILKSESRIKAGIQALRHGAPKKPATSKPAASGGNDWRPSQKTLDDVYAALAQSADPMTTREIAEQTGISRGTVTKSVEILRSEERVRLAGNAASPGAPKVYGVMP
jgi:DNA invertase Pin-like site-specific DNA recombinase